MGPLPDDPCNQGKIRCVIEWIEYRPTTRVNAYQKEEQSHDDDDLLYAYASLS